MIAKEKSRLLEKYEKIKGFSSNLFNNEEWAEFDAFIEGYKLAVKEDKEQLEEAFNAGFNCPIAGATFEEWKNQIRK